MGIKDKLQVILITYNRLKHVQRTFEQLFAEGSPIIDYDLLVLDNNSTDGTADFVKEFMQTHKNVSYRKNKYNLGISGNIAKAMEIAEKEYVWIICDDDKYDFSNWSEVENAINNDEEVLCVARYAIPDEHKNHIEYQLLQMTFIPAIIFKTTVFNDTVMRNAFDNIYTLFPHICPVVSAINNNKPIYVVDKAIVDNGMNLGVTDVSYTRGCVSGELYPKTRTMKWIVGYANICSALRDEDLKHRALTVAIDSKDIHNGFMNFCAAMYIWYSKQENWPMLMDVFTNLSKDQQQLLIKVFTQIISSKNLDNPKLIEIISLLEKVVSGLLDSKINT